MTGNPIDPKRRRYLRTIGALGIAGVAGCSGSENGGGGENNTDEENDSGSPTASSETTPTDNTTPTAENPDLTPWMSLHADPERTRSTPDQVPTTLSKVAEGGTPPLPGGGTNHFTLITSEGIVHLGTSYIAGYDRATFERRFSREFGGTLDRASKMFEGMNVIPGYVEGGTLIAGIKDNILGLSVTDGSRDWIVEGSGIPFPTEAGIGVNSQSDLRLLGSGSQTTEWEMGVGRFGLPVVHTDSGTVYLPGSDDVVALDIETGEQQWSRSISGGGFNDVKTPFAVQGETLYVINEERTLALDRTDGTTQWEYGSVTKGPAGSLPAYAVDEDGIYLQGDGILALDPSTGTELWSTPTSTGVLSIAVGAENLAYRAENRVRVLSKTSGESQAAADVEGAKGKIAIAGGRIYVRQGGINRKLIAFGAG